MKATILVVDDMPEVRAYMTSVLEGAGYRVSTAATFERGKELLDRNPPDLLMLDIRLGMYNGLQLAVKFHSEHPTRPVLVMSGYVDPVLVQEAQRHGAEFLEKPIEPARLLSVVERMLSKRNTSETL